MQHASMNKAMSIHGVQVVHSSLGMGIINPAFIQSWLHVFCLINVYRFHAQGVSSMNTQEL